MFLFNPFQHCLQGLLDRSTFGRRLGVVDLLFDKSLHVDEIGRLVDFMRMIGPTKRWFEVLPIKSIGFDSTDFDMIEKNSISVCRISIVEAHLSVLVRNGRDAWFRPARLRSPIPQLLRTRRMVCFRLMLDRHDRSAGGYLAFLSNTFEYYNLWLPLSTLILQLDEGTVSYALLFINGIFKTSDWS